MSKTLAGQIFMSTPQRRSLSGLLISFALIAISSWIAVYNNNKINSEDLFSVSKIQIPGQIKLSSISDLISENQPFSIYLETQIEGSHLRKKRGPLLNKSRVDFLLDIEFEYSDFGGSKRKESSQFSSGNILDLFSIEDVNLGGTDYIRFPIISFNNIDLNQPIIINFRNENSNSQFYDTEIYIKKTSLNHPAYIWIPITLFTLGIMIASMSFVYIVLIFYRRDL
ncbi:MAG TPA: hypothetical protein PKA63_00055 [Oligoflexia bacterium]|mgnify:CR=1 FL=1|nr:hypothetical protein [Oligoflexia bacterium]HMP47040.1 hypothetical protein [Oligoflexia bacterium]